MQHLLDAIKEPWPWYVGGPIIGLLVPILLIIGNKSFGISASLRHICAACLPANISFFKYDWKKEVWNLFFIIGIFFGAAITTTFLRNDKPVQIHENLREELASYGVTEINSLLPEQLFNVQNLLTLQGFILMIVGGFLVGFGTRYAGGCTSGHAIMGISQLQWPSVIATCCFMVGGFTTVNFILPYILSL